MLSEKFLAVFFYFSLDKPYPPMVYYTHTDTHIGIKIEEGFDETNHGKVGNPAGMGRLEKRNHPAGDFRNFFAAESVSHSTAVFDCMGCDYPVWCADYFRSHHRVGHSV